MTKNLKIAIIGSGFSGLSAACYLAKENYEVHVFEKNETIGGRARQFKTDNGYTFDMGPSWYWMPDVIEDFFNDFGYQPKDFYELIELNPQFEIVFEQETVQFPSLKEEMVQFFEHFEKGAGANFTKFMKEAEVKYEIGIKQFITKPCHSWLEFFSIDMAINALKLDILTDYRSYVSKYFSNPFLKSIMEFPVIFLGASPKNIPALYSLMNYGGYMLGTWYPMGGFFKVIEAMHRIANENYVQFHLNAEVSKINHTDKKAKSIVVNGQTIEFDYIIGSADYHHVETLLDQDSKNYSENYWKNKTFAPSCLIYYLGVNEEIPNLKHHTLFFEPDLDPHIDEIYSDKKWPTEPLFYVCCPSKTDPNVAPKNHENLFLLMPLAIDLEDNEQNRAKYFDIMIERIEHKTGVKNLKAKIDYKRSYCITDFKHDYNAFGGNAYGLANTLKQTAVLKPSIKNKKIDNLYYTGQLTVPGPGVPPSIISGKIVANEINLKIKTL